jgi:NAD+ synthase
MSGIIIAIAQINVTVGDIDGNRQKILDYYERAAAQGAQLVVFPELCVTGYPPEDLILAPAFRAQAMEAARALAAQTKNKPAMIVGCVWEEGDKIYNAALLLDDGKIAHMQPKTCLPNYGIFDEKRLFTAGTDLKPVDWRGHKIGLLVCEDVWHEKVAMAHKKRGAEILIVINASPFEAGKMAQRQALVASAAKECALPAVYVNMVGGQDDIVFDGGSFAVDEKGVLCAQLPEFEEGLFVIPSAVEGSTSKTDPSAALRSGRDDSDRLWNAMCLGLRDYVRKNGFSTVLLGLSGGIDSAFTAAVAVDALGKDHVKGVLMPSPYSSKESIDDALESARFLGIETFSVPNAPAMQMFDEVLSPVFKTGDWMEDVAVGGNLQARLRGLTLMAMSNKFDWLLLSTGNKSEIAVGYTTLYGDSCGGYNVIKDLYKTQIYALADWRNARSSVIPKRSISKAPSAELKPGQKDADQLPPYDVLDRILALHIEGRLSAQEIIAQGFARDVVEKIVDWVRRNEYKRRQSCPGVKLSPMLFGKDRRFPLTNSMKP